MCEKYRIWILADKSMISTEYSTFNFSNVFRPLGIALTGGLVNKRVDLRRIKKKRNRQGEKYRV